MKKQLILLLYTLQFFCLSSCFSQTNKTILRYEIIESNYETTIKSKRDVLYDGKNYYLLDSTYKLNTQNKYSLCFNLKLYSDTIGINYGFKLDSLNYLPLFHLSLQDTAAGIDLVALLSGKIVNDGETSYKGKLKETFLNEKKECFMFSKVFNWAYSIPKKKIITDYYITTDSLIPVRIIEKVVLEKDDKTVSYIEITLENVISLK